MCVCFSKSENVTDDVHSESAGKFQKRCFIIENAGSFYCIYSTSLSLCCVISGHADAVITTNLHYRYWGDVVLKRHLPK